MSRQGIADQLGLGVAMLFVPRMAMTEDHLAEAISHTKEAIEHGKIRAASTRLIKAKRPAVTSTVGAFLWRRGRRCRQLPQHG